MSRKLPFWENRPPSIFPKWRFSAHGYGYGSQRPRHSKSSSQISDQSEQKNINLPVVVRFWTLRIIYFRGAKQRQRFFTRDGNWTRRTQEGVPPDTSCGGSRSCLWGSVWAMEFLNSMANCHSWQKVALARQGSHGPIALKFGQPQ